jgi:acetate kinase
MRILVINCGSSSIKYKFFEMPKGEVISAGLVEHIGEKGSKVCDYLAGIRHILQGLHKVEVIGHRVVHGFEKFIEPVLIDSRVIKKIRQCSQLAPLHNPANLDGILACKKLLPKVGQVAVFDTAFHHTLPDYAYIYGLPYEYYERLGIRKYGFHGTSHEYVAGEAAKVLKRPLAKLKIITCHLGNGCSITAIDKGKSVDTSMGFTPLEGLIMGTRCGDIDPALVTFTMRNKKIDAREMDEILNKKSGLKGISGISNDMRELLSRAGRGHKRARLAVDIFVYRAKKYIGAYIAVMGGLDVLVFTAGIGEHAKLIRDKICRGSFAHLKKPPKILVVPTNEELLIARKSYNLLRAK